jgi:KDO2-lipid IV(A) lauroyltransferase
MTEAPKPEPVAPTMASHAGTDDGVPLSSFLGPRYWATWVFVAWLKLVAALPWRAAIRLHRSLGGLGKALMRRQRAIISRNIEICCFPELSQTERAALVARNIENFSVFLAEVGISWFGNPERYAHLFRIEGTEHLHAGLARGRGVLLFSGHFTTLEICVPVIKTLVPFSMRSCSARVAMRC